MDKTIIAEGKTTNEAIENGLKILNVSKDKVDVKVLEEEKRSFYNILAPRVVKVELTVKDESAVQEKKETKIVEKKEIILSSEEQEIVKQNVENFLKDFIKYLPENTQYEVEKTTSGVSVNITNDQLGYLIGYRGETLYAMQNILTAIAGKNVDKKVMVSLDIEGYKNKRVKTLEDLAEKVARTVVKTRKAITLEPMGAYERKVIHSKLQGNSQVETNSIGEEPRRRIVISLKK